MTRSFIATAIIVAATLAPSTAVGAQATVAPPLPIAPSAGRAVPSPDGRQIIDDAELGDYRGGQTTVVASQTLTGVATGNVLNGDYAAGAVIVSDKALSAFSGIGNFAINTGAQVSLQSGMNVTINVTQ